MRSTHQDAALSARAHSSLLSAVKKCCLALMTTVVTSVAVLGFTQPAQAAFGLNGPFLADVTDLQAGGHPDAFTSFAVNTLPNGGADGEMRDINVELPPGLVGNPTAVGRCELSYLTFDGVIARRCPRESMVGVADILLDGLGPQTIPVYNIQPAKGTPASFAFNIGIYVTVRLDASLEPDGQYHLEITSHNTSQLIAVLAANVTLWGVPADHNGPGPGTFSAPFEDITYGGGGVSARTPFMTNPADCNTPGVAKLLLTSWQAGSQTVTANADPRQVFGCDALDFSPSVESVPSTSEAGKPAGLRVGLGFPYNLDPDGLGTPPLRNARVTLPEGMTINPSVADGLVACSDAQLGLGSKAPSTCPDAAQIGTVEATTPVLDETLTGAVYIRPQNSDDPQSGEMFRMAIVMENAERGISIRLPGQVRVDPGTGRVTATFLDNPQLPVTKLNLRMRGGDRSVLANSRTCGSGATRAELTPWSSEVAAVRTPGYATTQSCDQAGKFEPALKAGSADPRAGASSPFTFALSRPSGQQDINGVTAELPTGLLAELRGVSQCREAEASAGSCPASSKIGRIIAAAGVGQSPIYLPQAGKTSTAVYLAGPYKGAPFSLSMVVPAQAGPFDLGNVVVRAALYVDAVDAHVRVVSDPIPTIVRGVPVSAQQINVVLDRSRFMLNPTSCAPKTIAATVSSAAGLSVVVTNHFQASECPSLDLKPELALSLSGKGQTTDNKHPAVTAVVSQKPGQANLKKVRVALPLSVALDPDNANGLCEFVDGSKVEPMCPKASIVGSATAVTPILDEPLSGPVYFVKNIRKDPKSGREIRTLPKLVIPLVGQNGLRLTLTGTSDVEDDRLVTTFDNIPDAPVSSFKMSIIGGKGGILVVSGTDICKASQVADQQIDGQNNKNADADVYIQTPSCPLKVISKKVGKTSVAVKVGGLGAGKVTVTGKGIKKTTKTIAKSTVATITAKRSKGKPGKVTVSFDPTGPAKARKTTK